MLKQQDRVSLNYPVMSDHYECDMLDMNQEFDKKGILSQ